MLFESLLVKKKHPNISGKRVVYKVLSLNEYAPFEK